MMTLRLKARSETFTVGPTEEIVFRGDEILIPGQAAAIARFERDAWIHAGKRCNVLECRAFVILQFEDSNENVGSRIGPRSLLCVRNRYVYAGRERVAKLHATNCWFQTGRQQSWPVLRVVLAGTRP